MENVNGYDQGAQIMNELLEGQESAKELWNQVHEQRNGSLSDDHHQALKCSLMEKMMSSFDKTIELARKISIESRVDEHPPVIANSHFELGSPRSLALGSPRSENSHRDLRPYKRRKTMPRWTKIVQVSQGKSINGLEGPLDDGFGWRKYGQKDILGAKFPRGYYRCTHRHSSGCAATKQVQRSDEDHAIYQIMYRGEHTCSTGPQLNKAQNKPSSQIKSEEQPFLSPQKQSPPSPQEQYQSSQSVHQEVFMGLGSEEDLKVEPEETQTQTKAQIFRCFSFTTALLEPEPFDNYYLSYSADFASSLTSDSNYFRAPSYQLTGPHVVLNVEPITDPNSVTNSPTLVDFEFPLEQLLEIDPNFF